MNSKAPVINLEAARRRRTRSRRPPSDGPDTGSALGKGLTDESMRELTLRFTDPHDERGFRDRALFLIMSRTALRAAEVVSLRWSMLVQLPEGAQAFRVRTKGGKIHFAVPGHDALTAVRVYQEGPGITSDFLFHSLPNRALSGGRTVLSTRGLQKIVNAWSAQTGTGRQAHPHALRHTAVQRTFDLAGSMAAQKLAGHCSPVVTSRHYTRPYFNGAGLLRWDS